MKEGGAAAVKLEGGRRVRDHVRLLVDSGIPVMGHLGFTPQSVHALGGAKVQGRGEGAGERLLRPEGEVFGNLPPDEPEGGDKEAYIDAVIARARTLLGEAGFDDYRRKVEELLLAHKLSETYTKEQILEWYLNTNFYGNLAYGVIAGVLVAMAAAGSLAPLAGRPGGLSGPMGFLMTMAIAAALLVLSLTGVNATGAFELLWGSVLATRPTDLWLLGAVSLAVAVLVGFRRRQLALLLYDREIALTSGVAVGTLVLVVLVVVAAAIASASTFDELITARQSRFSRYTQPSFCSMSSEAGPKRLSGIPCHRLMKLCSLAEIGYLALIRGECLRKICFERSRWYWPSGLSSGHTTTFSPSSSIRRLRVSTILRIDGSWRTCSNTARSLPVSRSS